MHLVGFIIRIYHYAQSPEFYPKNKFEKLVHLVGFIIRIYHVARSPERIMGRYCLGVCLHKENDRNTLNYVTEMTNYWLNMDIDTAEIVTTTRRRSRSVDVPNKCLKLSEKEMVA